MRIIIVTGISGSGKSVALNVMEDAGYYTVDNLPVRLLEGLVSSLAMEGYKRIAAAVDARTGQTIVQLPEIVKKLKAEGHEVRVLFLKANNDTLVQRYSETRRRHPLSHLVTGNQYNPQDTIIGMQGEATLPECIDYERALMSPLEWLGHQIDTSDLRASTLRAWISEFLDDSHTGVTMLFQSFAFKHGLPTDADLVFDVRALPNPYYDINLRPLTGRDKPVIEYLLATEEGPKMLADIKQFLEHWLPNYSTDGRSYLTIAIGCTGGQHRSVFIAESLAAHFKTKQHTLVRHRELPQILAKK